MRILSCVPYSYYEAGKASYEYLSFVECLRNMGHEVHHFDYVQQAQVDRLAMNGFFLSVVKMGRYDLVLVVTNEDQFKPEILDEAKHHSTLVAWNCDDDWRWTDYSSRWAGHFTWMVTTYRHIYEAHRHDHPNLVLSQWGCTGLCDGWNVGKRMPMSFVGGNYGERGQQIERLRRAVGLIAYGRGVRTHVGLNLLDPANLKTKLRRRIARSCGIKMIEPDLALATQQEVKRVWNESRILFTPLEASTGGALQIKARVFDQGLSGGLMLCNRNKALHEFYEPNKEFVEYDDLDDCVNKARYYLGHESERRMIAEAYYRRTKTEHLWEHRFSRLFKDLGLCGARKASSAMGRESKPD